MFSHGSESNGRPNRLLPLCQMGEFALRQTEHLLEHTAQRHVWLQRGRKYKVQLYRRDQVQGAHRAAVGATKQSVAPAAWVASPSCGRPARLAAPATPTGLRGRIASPTALTAALLAAAPPRSRARRSSGRRIRCHSRWCILSGAPWAWQLVMARRRGAIGGRRAARNPPLQR